MSNKHDRYRQKTTNQPKTNPKSQQPNTKTNVWLSLVYRLAPYVCISGFFFLEIGLSRKLERVSLRFLIILVMEL